MSRNIGIKFILWAYNTRKFRRHVIQTNPSKFDERLFSDIHLCRLRLNQGREIHDFVLRQGVPDGRSSKG